MCPTALRTLAQVSAPMMFHSVKALYPYRAIPAVKRRVRAHKGHETGQHDGRDRRGGWKNSSVAGQVGSLQDSGVVLEPAPARMCGPACSPPGPPRSAAAVIDADQDGQSELQLLVQQSGGEQQRVTRQEREEDTGFDEDHCRDCRPMRPGRVLGAGWPGPAGTGSRSRRPGPGPVPRSGCCAQ
jgi:hypothetical protein